jgi:hypothetical protein
MRPFSRFPFSPLLLALAASVLVPLSAEAGGGNALVIGESSYAGVTVLPNCQHAADLLSARLRGLGFTVDELVDASAGATRVAINRFAGDVASMPDQPSFAYVCGAGITEERRLFLLASDVDLQLPLDPETQGVVVPALLNAIDGSNGTLIGELAMQSTGDERPTLEALRDRLPSGLHLAVTMTDAQHAGSLGRVLAEDATPLTGGWDGLAPVLRAHADKSVVALYAPPPAPQQPPAAVATPAPPPATKPTPPTAPASDTGPAPAIAPASDTAPPPKSAPAPVAAAAPPPPPPPPDLAPATPTTPAPQTAMIAPLPVISIPPAPPEQPVARPPRPAEPARIRPPRGASYPRVSGLRAERLQIALRDQGLYNGPVDGVMDTRTIMAIRAYQISIGRPSSGTLTGSEIIQLLNSR